MRLALPKRSSSLLGHWWWTVDRWVLSALGIIILLGVLMNFASSPPVAQRLGLDPFFFVKRHVIMLPLALGALWGVSLLSTLHVRRLALGLYFLGLFLLFLTFIWGVEIKGARRWLSFAGISLQPSELVKPALSVISAWMIAEKIQDASFPGLFISLLFLALVVTGLLLQPDLGMTVVVVLTWLSQIFVAGLPFIWIILLLGCSLGGLLGCYFFLPHVARRMDQFFHQGGNIKDDLYQIHQSLEAFKSGGLFGRGPGEGIVKKHIPDAHADFIFAVAGEEFGLVVCLAIVGLFGFVVIRTFWRAFQETSPFVMIALVGLSTQFGLQTLINMASTLHLIPTKGMTLPFVSYGGSSLIALGLGTGMLLALSRKRHSLVDGVL